MPCKQRKIKSQMCLCIRLAHLRAKIFMRTALLLLEHNWSASMLDCIVANVLPRLLSRRVEIVFHCDEVPAADHGGWRNSEVSSPDTSETEARAYHDLRQISGAQLREVDVFLRMRFNFHEDRLTFTTEVEDETIKVIGNVFRSGLIANFASVSRTWMQEIVRVISGKETIVLRS